MLCVYGIGTVYDAVVFVEIVLKFMFLYTYERYLNILCVCNEISESFEKKCWLARVTVRGNDGVLLAREDSSST